MTADFVLRPANAGDAGAVRGLVRRVHINPTGLDWRRFILAVDGNGQLLGCGQLKPHGTAIVELASIAVEPEYRQRGIAQAIIDELLSKGPRPLYLTCRSALGPFYEKWGFRVLGHDEMPVYYRRLSRLARFISSVLRDDGMLVMMLK